MPAQWVVASGALCGRLASSQLSSSAPVASLGLWLAVFLAAALKIAQGSGTVAITVTAAIMAPMMEDAGLADPRGRAVTVVAIGAGSMIVCHVNDSFFWVPRL